MKTQHPSPDDAKRLANLIEGLASLDDDDELDDDAMRAEAEASGIDFAAWAARIQAEIEARAAERKRQARRRRAMTSALAAGLMVASAAGGVSLALKQATPDAADLASSAPEATQAADRTLPAAPRPSVAPSGAAGVRSPAEPRPPASGDVPPQPRERGWKKGPAGLQGPAGPRAPQK